MSLEVYNEEGWICVAMHDPDGRRGLWYRLNKNGLLEFRAGREGDDAYVAIFDARASVPAMINVFECARYAFEMDEEAMNSEEQKNANS